MTHPDIVAQLSLGTWRYLLPNRNPRKDPGKQRLWEDALAAAFPHLARGPADLVSDISDVHGLRNRVAHLEPLLRPGYVERHVRAMQRVLAEIEPSAERWLIGSQRITTVLGHRPVPSWATAQTHDLPRVRSVDIGRHGKRASC